MRPTRGRTLAIVPIYAVSAFRSSVSLVRLPCGPPGDSTRRRALLAVHWQHRSSLRGPAVAMRFTRARTAGRRRRRRACHCHSQCTPHRRPRDPMPMRSAARDKNISVSLTSDTRARTRDVAHAVLFLPRSRRSFTPAAVFAAEAKQHELQLPL
jgi:hypothetical protein